MRSALFAAVLALAAPARASASPADDPAAGFELVALPYPGHALTATRPSGEIVSWDGLAVRLHAAGGALLQTLATFPAAVYPSFALIDPGDSFALVGESTNGDIFEVDLAAGGAQLVANVYFHYDAKFEDAEHLLVSAAAGGFSAGNDLLRLELATGATTLLAHVGGPSGPLALDAAGNLFYATQDEAFPAPPGSTEVLIFEASKLTGSPVLSEADAILFGLGFDGGSSLAFDDDEGALYMAVNSVASGANRIVRVNGTPSSSPVLVEGSAGRWISNLELATARDPAAFLGYQPASGGMLRYNATDFAAVFERSGVVPRRAELSLAGPGTLGPGPFTVDVEGGVPGGTMLLAFAPQSAALPTELALELAGLPPFFLALDPAALHVIPVPFALDGAGAASLPFLNPGGLEGALAIQGLLFAGAFPAGTSKVVLN